MKKLFFTLLTLCLCGATYAAADFSAEVTNADGTSTTFYFNILETTDGSKQVEVTYGSQNQPSSSNANVYSGAITVPETVTYQGDTYDVVGLGEYAFARSAGLTSLVIPGCVTYLGSHASSNCTSLTSVILQESDTPITAGYESSNDQGVFRYSTALSEVICNRNIDVITDHYCAPFRGCTGLTKVSIGGKATEVCDYCFYGCTALMDVTLSDSITSINQYAFSDCTSLQNIVIPASVKSFANFCFRDCTALKALFLQDTDPSTESVYPNDFADDAGLVIYVPRGSAAAYAASSWMNVADYDNMSFNFYNLTTISEQTIDSEGNYYYATYYYDGEGDYTYEIDDTSSTIYAVTSVSNGVAHMEALTGDIIPSGTPLLIESSTPGGYYMWRNYYDEDNTPFYSDGTPTTITVPEGNMLYGHSESGETSVNGETNGYLFYKLSLDPDGTSGSIGFYYGGEGGAAYTAGANRCWLAVPSDSSSEVISLKKGDSDDTTGISSVESATEGASVKGIYTVQGVRVSNMNQPGLYIVDGKKVLVK